MSTNLKSPSIRNMRKTKATAGQKVVSKIEFFYLLNVVTPTRSNKKGGKIDKKENSQSRSVSRTKSEDKIKNRKSPDSIYDKSYQYKNNKIS